MKIKPIDQGIRAISADSHVAEPPGCFIDNIEAKYRDTAPRMEYVPGRGAAYVIDGLPGSVPMSFAAAAGRDPQELKDSDKRFEDLRIGSHDGKARIADQDRDGVAAEFVYPTVGMVVCNHHDPDYKRACMQAYNRWMTEFQSAAPDRLFGLPMTAIRTVDEGIADLQSFKDQGFKGVMLPGYPSTDEDYDHPAFDKFWDAVEELNMPVSFHVFTGNKGGKKTFNTFASGDKAQAAAAQEEDLRGPPMNKWNEIIRANQDLIGMFVLSGIFEKHPDVKVVGVEGDAGWAPHFSYRLDHAFAKHRYWLKPGADLKRKPSEYFNENIYLTFQDDWVAFKVTNLMNPRRLLWANDYPHSDSTWPLSQELLAEHTSHLSDQEKRWILRDNVAELYGVNPA